MWEALREIVRIERVGLNDLVTAINRERGGLSLTAAIRVYIVNFYRAGHAVPMTVAAYSV